MEKFKFLGKEKISSLPKTTGVYCFKKDGELLYIGKAVNIQERVKQHKELLGLAEQLGYIKTNSEIEALLLEAKLIKKHQPKYNIVWRDDKNYFYVEITKEEFPRVLITHQPGRGETSSIIGPFVEGRSLKRTLTYLRRVFPYYTAKKHPLGNCLWCSLNLCPGPLPDKEEYQKNIRNLTAVLEGRSKIVLKNLKREMKQASASRAYEKAAGLRDRIVSLEKVMSYSRVIEPSWLNLTEVRPRPIGGWDFKRIEAYDVSNIQGKEATGSMVVFKNNKPDKSQYRKFKIKVQGKPNDIAMLKEILNRRLKHKEWPLPDLILIDGGKAQFNAAKSILSRSHLGKIGVVAIAKKKNELYLEGKKKPVLLKSLPREIFNLILQLRDEAHRFAITYHKKLRNKNLIGR
jgi:excinuclease ABC subunit C